MLVFYGKKSNPKAGLTQEQGVLAARAISDISTWLGSLAKWKVRCVSLAEATEILAGCKRVEKENLRRARLDLRNRFSSTQLHSSLSAAAKPFKPLATSSANTLMKGVFRQPEITGETSGVETTHLISTEAPTQPLYMSNDEGSVSEASSSSRRRQHRGKGRHHHGGRENSDSEGSASSGGRRKKKDGFSNKLQIPEFGGKKEHPTDVAEAFREWARRVSNYREYYEDSYLMPLVVSALTGDASRVLDWAKNNNPASKRNLTMVLKTLREHYCGSYTFQEQRNMVENLRQGSREEAKDFLIWVDNDIAQLVKDWEGRLTEAEREALQYEVSLNGVREEIRHVLDSQIAKYGRLTPFQMYEAVKKYETYVARNKRLDGKQYSQYTGQPRAASQVAPSYKANPSKPRFHRTTAFVTSTAEMDDTNYSEPEPEPLPEDGSAGLDLVSEEEDGLFIPPFLKETTRGDCALQVKMARTIQANEKQVRRCFICDQPDHLNSLLVLRYRAPMLLSLWAVTESLW